MWIETMCNFNSLRFIKSIIQITDAMFELWNEAQISITPTINKLKKCYFSGTQGKDY